MHIWGMDGDSAMPSATMHGVDVRDGARRKVFRADVQGLRMVAVVAVILDHLLGWPSGGFVGVDVFFVISGFLITSLLLREHDKTGSVSFVGFYRRRVKRILPAATLVVVATVGASYLLFSRVRATETLWDGIWASVFAANWHFAANGTDYFQPEVMVSPLQHYWSLSVEEQFYFVWPWLMVAVFWVAARVAARRGGMASSGTGRRIVGFTIAAIVIVSFVWSVRESAQSPTWAYFSTFSRAWELGLGAAIAVYAPLLKRIPDNWRPVLGWLGLAGIGAALFVVNDTLPFPGPWALLPVGATALVIAAGTGGPQRFLWPLTNPVSTYVGDASYSLYLWHWPVIVLLGACLPLTSPGALAVAAAVIIALSLASYHFFEDPIRRSRWLDPRPHHGTRRRRWRPSRMVAPKLITVALTTTAVTALVAFALAPRSAPAVPADDQTAVFLGDSYTVGAGSTEEPWPLAVSTAFGWTAQNLAAGGTGYVQTASTAGCGRDHCGNYLEESQKITGSPSVIIVSGGRNDPGDDVSAAAGELFSSLRSRFPGASIVAFSPWWDAGTPPASLASKAAGIQKAAEAAGVTYVDTGQPFAGHPEWISEDGVHPNADGYRALTSQLIPLLAQATGDQPRATDTPADVDALSARTDQIRAALKSTEWPTLTPAVDNLGDAARVPEWDQDHCLDVSADNVDACVYGDPSSSQSVALIGDSHAISYMPTLRGAFPDRRLQSLTMKQCPAAAVDVQLRTSQGSSDYPECDAHREWAMAWIADHKPQTVVLVDTWDTPTRMAGDETAANLQAYRAALTTTLNTLTATGSHVIVLASPPPGLNLADCKTPLSSPRDCVRTVPRSYLDWSQGLADAVSASSPADGTTLVPTLDWFCDGGSCPSFINDVAIFADGNHLTDPAAKAVAPLLVADLAQ